MVLVLLTPINPFAVTQADRSSQDSRLADAGVELLGPQMPTGYHLDGAGAESSVGDGPTFFYVISPDGPGLGSTATAEQVQQQEQQEIRVVVGLEQPGFTPPTHCAAVTSVYPVPSPACTPVAPGVWRWSNHDYVEYVARVGNTVAVLQATVPPVKESVLVELARTMAVRAPSYFTGG